MIINVDKEGKEAIETIITVAMKSLNSQSILGLASLVQSINLIEEPKDEPEKKKEK